MALTFIHAFCSRKTPSCHKLIHPQQGPIIHIDRNSAEDESTFFADLSLIAFGFAPCWQFLLCYYVVIHSCALAPNYLVSYHLCLSSTSCKKKTNLTKHNSNKTKLLVVAAKLLLWRDGDNISPCSEVHNLGVMVNLTLSSVLQEKNISKYAFLLPQTNF